MSRGLHWFRADLRLRDNTALAALASRVEQFGAVFVLDPRLLRGERAGAVRTRFVLECLTRLQAELARRGLPLRVLRGHPEQLLPRLLHESGAHWLSFNEGATPFARRRDAAVRRAVERAGGAVLALPDHVVFRADEVRSASGGGYRVYTPYRRAWWKRWRAAPRPPLGRLRLPAPIPDLASDPVPAPPAAKGGASSALPAGGEAEGRRRLARFAARGLRHYAEDRDQLDCDGTSRLSAHLRFGALSPRECVQRACEAAQADPQLRRGAAKWLDELVWREFYSALLEEHPRTLRESFRPEGAALEWEDDAEGFAAWADGRTGFPLVDAGMRQLRACGWLHNRVRMVVASFLCKHLGIDWRAGERHFFQLLADGDPASNSGNWQWVASTGADAQPSFRVFNPTAQGRRWDPDGRYLRRWLPELARLPAAQLHEPPPLREYPPPIVDHAQARERALERARRARLRARGAREGSR